MVALHIRNTYGLIVLHPDLDAILATSYREKLAEVYGEPVVKDGVWYWELPPLSQDEKAKLQAASGSQAGQEDKELSCRRPSKMISMMLASTPQTALELRQKVLACGQDLLKYCMQRVRVFSIDADETELCLHAFRSQPQNNDLNTLLQLLHHPNTRIRSSTADVLLSRQNIQSIRDIYP